MSATGKDAICMMAWRVCRVASNQGGGSTDPALSTLKWGADSRVQ